VYHVPCPISKLLHLLCASELHVLHACSQLFQANMKNFVYALHIDSVHLDHIFDLATDLNSFSVLNDVIEIVKHKDIFTCH